MPTTARVSGEMYDASGSPIVGGKVVATLVGDDFFQGGRQIITDEVSVTTDAQGQWFLELLVNAEGEGDTTSWTVTGYNQNVKQVWQRKGLFIATGDPITINDLVKLSPANLAAAKSADLATLFVVDSFAEYTALPASQKAPNDIVLVKPGA